MIQGTDCEVDFEGIAAPQGLWGVSSLIFLFSLL